MTACGNCALGRLAAMLAAALSVIALCPHSADAGSCSWPAAKIEVDQVLSGEAQRSAEFRRLVGTGRDSLDTLLSLLPQPARQAVEDCTVETSEYLTDKGFPLQH